MTIDHLALFLDTNSLLHYPPIRDIDWCRICDADRVTLVVCMQVINELDEKKDDGRLGDRARRAIKEIKTLLAGEKTVRKDVTMEVFNQTLRAEEFPGVNGGGKVQRRAVADGRPKSVAPLV